MIFIMLLKKVSKGAKIRYRYKHVPHLTQDTNGKVANSQLYTTNESQEVLPSPANRRSAYQKQVKVISITSQII